MQCQIPRVKIRKVAVSSSRNSKVIRESWRQQQITVISLKGKGKRHLQRVRQINQEFLANEVATAQEHAINELNNSKECLLALRDADNQLRFIQKEVDKLKQEEQRLTSRVQRLKNKERQEQYVQRPQSAPQLVSQQSVHST